jgi:hypothetical protein
MGGFSPDPQGFDETERSVGLRLENLPAFSFRLWWAFDNPNHVTDFKSVLFVMRPILFGLPNDFLQNRMLKATLNRHSYGLFIRGAGHSAFQDTFGHRSGAS